MYSDIKTKLTLHNEAEAPFEHIGLVDSFDGYDVLQTRDYVKLSAESYIRRLLKAHGWNYPSPCDESKKPSHLYTKAMLLIYSIWQQVWLRMLPNIKLLKLNKALVTGVCWGRLCLPTCSVDLTSGMR